jgi:hypothetical protein
VYGVAAAIPCQLPTAPALPFCGFHSSIAHPAGVGGGGAGLSLPAARARCCCLQDAATSRLRLAELLDGSDDEFVARLGLGPQQGAGDDAYPSASGEGASDYERYRAMWLETEGVRWSGVNAVSGGGSW